MPVDEHHPIHPQDPYALSKHFGEQLCDAAVRRSDLRCISIRPSHVQYEGNYERNLGPQVRDPSVLSPSLWSYIDVYDLADAIRLAKRLLGWRPTRSWRDYLDENGNARQTG